AQEWRGGGGGLLADLISLPSRARLERERRTRAREVLEWCGLTSLAFTPAGAVPIGISRMVELGRAVVDGASVFLLVEPPSGRAPSAPGLSLTGPVHAGLTTSRAAVRTSRGRPGGQVSVHIRVRLTSTGAGGRRSRD